MKTKLNVSMSGAKKIGIGVKYRGWPGKKLEDEEKRGSSMVVRSRVAMPVADR